MNEGASGGKMGGGYRTDAESHGQTYRRAQSGQTSRRSDLRTGGRTDKQRQHTHKHTLGEKREVLSMRGEMNLVVAYFIAAPAHLYVIWIAAYPALNKINLT